jgi:hypothetical protein
MACTSCERHLAEYLPEIKTVSLYEILSQKKIEAPRRLSDKAYAVFDPCAARNRSDVRQAVRRLAELRGCQLEELPKADKHGCCGFGGNVAVANPEFAEYVGKMRSGLSDNPYVVYCINCREVFQDAGKESLHILDLLFDVNPEDRKLPDFTERRANKIILKERLLKEFWNEEMQDKPEEPECKLLITPQVREKMNKLMLLEADIGNVLTFSLKSKRRTYDQERNTYLCYRELGNITCWLEYRPQGESFEITNIYTHRMKIEIEEVWNGRKTDADLR